MEQQVQVNGSHTDSMFDEIPLERPEADNCSPLCAARSNASGHSHEVQADACTERHQRTWGELVPKLAQSIARMEVTRPEVVRVTEAFHAFEACATALRDQDGDFFHKSRMSDQIATFWSHSWHGVRWKKIITLILFYSGFPAMLLSFLTAAVAMLLFALGVLPGFDRGMVRPEIHFSTWSLCSGVLVASLVVLLWRPQSRVFVDRICISQADHDLKVQAIFSLAGLLRKSETMLILWDPTWTQRLWCLFEFAAFLKSRQSKKQVLVVRPILFGQVSIAMFLTVFAVAIPFTTVPVTPVVGAPDTYLTYVVPLAGALLLGPAVGYWTVSVIRSYFRDLDVMKEQLLSISFDRTLISCCEQEHVGPSGEPLLCDRQIVKECVNIWFGSQEAFEDTVRSDVLEILMRDLSERVFTTAWALSVSSPILWAFLDICTSFFQAEADWPTFLVREHVAAYAIEGLTIWLLAIPNIKDVILLICRITRKGCEPMGLEILKNLAALFLVFLQVLLVVAAFLVTRGFGSRVMTAGLFCGSMLMVSIAFWIHSKCRRILGRKKGW